MPNGHAFDERIHEVPSGTKLAPRACPRLVATGATFDFPAFLTEWEIFADVVWCAGEVSELHNSPAPTSGFCVYLEQYDSQLWEQVDDLLEFCRTYLVELSRLSYEGVDLVAVLFPHGKQGSREVELYPVLLGALAGLRVHVIIEEPPVG